MLHLVLVWPRYFVGSFDDDANYILSAQTIIATHGLAGTLSTGSPLLAGYPPGFPLLLLPFIWIAPHGIDDLRVMEGLSYLAVLPLTWHYLGTIKIPRVVRTGTVVLLAMNPVMATFGVMVMAEMPFLLCLLLLLIAVGKWQRDPRFFALSGIAVMFLGAAAVWLKEAGIGITLGVGLWLVLRRQWARGIGVWAAMGLFLLPVLVERKVNHIPAAGSRYTSELGGYYAHGIISGAIHVFPGALKRYVLTALPRTIEPFGQPLRRTPGWMRVEDIITVQASLFVLIGLAVVVKRYRDVAVVAVPVYMFESLFWPEVNERRVILVLPIVMAWYCVGLWNTARWLVGLAPSLRVKEGVTAGLAVVAIVVIVAPLSAQMPRDYLFNWYQNSPKPGGSRYMQMLKAVGPKNLVIENDYRNTTSLYTGHPTGWSAFTNTHGHGNCHISGYLNGIATDHAGFMLIGAVNHLGYIDSVCLLRIATRHPSMAVRLLRTDRDSASVFELIGPSSAHPDLGNDMLRATFAASGQVRMVPVPPIGRTDKSGDEPQVPTKDGGARLTWRFPKPVQLDQVSVGEAGTTDGDATSVELQIEVAPETWTTVASADRQVGDNPGAVPYLLAHVDRTGVLGVRVRVHGSGDAEALDVNALGPATMPSTGNSA